LWIKFAVYILPLTLLGQILIVWTNLLLKVTPFMMVLSSVTMLLMTPGVIALGIGLGAAYPDFGSENPAQAVTGFGGLLFMIVSAAFIGGVAILEAGPVYTIFMAGLRDQPLTLLQRLWAVVSFAAVALLSAVAVVWPMRFGARRLAK
jgi:ABC-2 type transport system permease protein